MAGGVIQSDAGPIIPHYLLKPPKETPYAHHCPRPDVLERLNRHPLLRARVENLLGVVEDAAGDCEQANAAGKRVALYTTRLAGALFCPVARRS